jgi:Fic family protein
MPSDWEEDSPQLRENLGKVVREIRDDARERRPWSVESVREWHVKIMHNLNAPKGKVGKFRGEVGLENLGVRIGAHRGMAAAQVADALAEFDGKLQRVVLHLDQLISTGVNLDADQLAAVLDLCAWAHAEWVRIHPFANGNGRTARLLANGIAMRYGLPPFVRLRPRPNAGYGIACEAAMRGNWIPTATSFHRMLKELLNT